MHQYEQLKELQNFQPIGNTLTIEREIINEYTELDMVFNIVLQLRQTDPQGNGSNYGQIDQPNDFGFYFFTFLQLFESVIIEDNNQQFQLNYDQNVNLIPIINELFLKDTNINETQNQPFKNIQINQLNKKIPNVVDVGGNRVATTQKNYIFKLSEYIPQLQNSLQYYKYKNIKYIFKFKQNLNYYGYIYKDYQPIFDIQTLALTPDDVQISGKINCLKCYDVRLQKQILMKQNDQQIQQIKENSTYQILNIKKQMQNDEYVQFKIDEQIQQKKCIFYLTCDIIPEEDYQVVQIGILKDNLNNYSIDNLLNFFKIPESFTIRINDKQVLYFGLEEQLETYLQQQYDYNLTTNINSRNLCMQLPQINEIAQTITINYTNGFDFYQQLQLFAVVLTPNKIK